MPSFDVVSELDIQEVRNAVDQASREVSQRYDFKGTDTKMELGDDSISLNSSSDERINAARQVLEEKLVKRKISLKAVDFGKINDAAGGRVSQVCNLASGISSDKAKEINKAVKEMGIKGIQSQFQGEQIRVTGKKRDDLQTVIAELRESSLGIPLQFINFRD